MLFWEDVLRLLAAAAAGAVIGFERELRDKPAGLRTNILICVGAALFTVLSVRMVAAAYSDPTRIAAQVVTGVGFLGAGAIMRGRGNVYGLTTAATIWGVASVGMTFGFGQFALGAVATALLTGVLWALSSAREAIDYRHTTVQLTIRINPSAETADDLRKQVRKTGLVCHSWEVTKAADGLTIEARLTGSIPRIERLQDALLRDERVRAFDRA